MLSLYDTYMIAFMKLKHFKEILRSKHIIIYILIALLIKLTFCFINFLFYNRRLTKKYHSGRYCSALNSSVDDYKLITDPLLPVNDGTNMTLSCSANHVNLENTISTAECKDGTVVATSSLPRCVRGELQTLTNGCVQPR